MEERGIKHSLVFIDPEGMEIHYDSIVKLVDEINCDLVINFPSAGVTRNLTTRDPETAATLRRFLGLDEKNPLPMDEESALVLYREKLAILGKDVSTEIAVRSRGHPFHYHLIPAVKTTRGGSPWFRMLQEAKERIERIGGSAWGIIAAQIDGRQSAIDDGDW